MLHLLYGKPLSYPDNVSLKSKLRTPRKTYYQKDDLNGDTTYIFITDIINIFDKIFVDNDKRYASKEQREMLETYCIEADTSDISEFNKQLDNYLGGYLGEDNDVYFTK